jgi:uncharacterized phiE125 gp8 family phage protein
MGRLVLVTAPEQEPVSLAEVKAHLRVDHDNDDALLGALIVAAREHLDGRDGWLGRALMPQTWQLVMDHFPFATDRYLGIRYPEPEWFAIRVPLPPLISVVSIKYIDSEGEEQILAEEQYVVDTASEPARIYPAYGTTWPTTRCIPNAVTVDFECGYPFGEPEGCPPVAPVTVPRPIRMAMLGLVAHWYENRVVSGPAPQWINALLAPYRVRM